VGELSLHPTTQSPRGGGPGRRDRAWAAGIGLLTLALFVLTLRQGVGGPEDSPKFQFVGRVLGTAHSPGYPLYVILTYLFGWLPIGTLAYRVNLFSAVTAAIACAGAFVIARQLGASRAAAAITTLGVATGAGFWHNAIVAEVYSLAAALVAVVVALLLWWDSSKRRAHLYAACAVFAVGLGNHLISLGLLPASLAFGIMRDRSVLRVRTLAIAAAIAVIGIGQYAFVMLRTVQGAPHLQARATTLGGLFDVLTAETEAVDRFRFSISQLFFNRLPAVANAVENEMGLAAVVLIAIGIGLGVRHRRIDIAFVACAAAGMLALIMNLRGDDVGFVVPVMVLLWPLAACGLTWLIATSRRFGRAAPAALTFAALLMPASNAIANREEIAFYRSPEDVRGLQALYSYLPAGAAVVAEDFWYGHVLRYFHFSGEFNPDPNPRVIGNDPMAVRDAAADGLDVYAFQTAVPWLEASGLEFREAPVPRSSMASWIRELPSGTTVAVATAGRPLPVEWLAEDDRVPSGRPAGFGTMAWTVGRPGARVDQHDRQSAAEITDVAGHYLLRVKSDDSGAHIFSGDDWLASVDRGLVLVTVTPDGVLGQRWQFSDREPLGVPLAQPVFVYSGEIPCVTLPAGEAVDVSGMLRDGGLVGGLEHDGEAAIDVHVTGGSDARFWPRTIQGRGRTALEAIGQDTYRLLVQRLRRDRQVFALTSDSPALVATARLAPGGEFSAIRVCHASPPWLPETGSLGVGPSENLRFASGWHDAERPGLLWLRWSQKTSTLVLPLQTPSAARLLLRLRAAHAAGATIRVSANGQAAGTCALAGGQWTDCRIEIPESHLRTGVNRVTLASDTAVTPGPGDPRELAFVMQQSLIRLGAP
jgi:hypothetical protein